MRIERGASNSMTLQARPTTVPSKWLLRFVKVDDPTNVQVCIASAVANTGNPVQLTFTEVSSGAVALSGTITLVPGQWDMSVHEQASTTNLDYLLSDRQDVFTALVEVAGPDAVSPPALTTCDIIEANTWPETKACLSEAALVAAEADLCGGGGGGDVDITVNGEVWDTITAPASDDVPVVNSAATAVGTVNAGVNVEVGDGTVTLGGVVIATPPAEGTEAVTCADLLDAVLVEGAGTANANGIYYRDDDVAFTAPVVQPRVPGSAIYVLDGPPQRVIYMSAPPSSPLFYNWLLFCTVDDVPLYFRSAAIANIGDPWDAAFIAAVGSAPAPTVSQATIGDLCPCDDATVLTTDGLTTVQTIGSGESGNLPQSVIKYKDAADASQVTAASNTEFASGTLRPATEVPRRQILNSAGGAANATFVDLDDLISNTLPVAGDATAVVKNLNGTTLITEAIPANASENITAPIPLKFGWGAGNADTLTWTVTDDEAGTYTAYTQDGGSGTITYSKNGGGYAALTGTISLAVSDTITVRRTITTNAGFSRWAP